VKRSPAERRKFEAALNADVNLARQGKPGLTRLCNLILSGHEEFVGKFGARSRRLVCAVDPGREKTIVRQFVHGIARSPRVLATLRGTRFERKGEL
jgi:hypothetical protein